MFKNFTRLLVFIICYFSIDYFLSSIFFFKLYKSDLEKIYFSDLENRIPNKEYKYTFKPNVDFYSKYNDFTYKISTNNFGFRDKKNLIINDFKEKKTFLFAGDSFLEGVGLNFEDTLLGHLDKNTHNEYNLLNSGVASYSPYLYKRKIISFINKNNFKIDKVIILLDKSDPIDDYRFKNHTGYFPVKKNESEIYQKKISERFITFAFLSMFFNYLDELQRNIKYRFILSRKYKHNFFEYTQNQVIAFKSIGNRKFITKYYTDENIWKIKTQNYIKESIKHIIDLNKFLKNKNIDLEIFIYPWSYELADKEYAKRYLDFMSNIFEKNDLSFYSCYKYFLKQNTLDQLEIIGKKYLYADVHYNSSGNETLSSCIQDKLKL